MDADRKTLDLSEAFRIAVEVHGTQLDKAGEPYLFHVMRVAMAMDTDEERVVAILHDSVEDTPGKLINHEGSDSYLPTPKCALLCRICDVYGERISWAVGALTRWDDEPYRDYMARVAQSPLATKIKAADIIDNSDPERLAKLAPEEAARLAKKYDIYKCRLCGGWHSKSFRLLNRLKRGSLCPKSSTR